VVGKNKDDNGEMTANKNDNEELVPNKSDNEFFGAGEDTVEVRRQVMNAPNGARRESQEVAYADCDQLVVVPDEEEEESNEMVVRQAMLEVEELKHRLVQHAEHSALLESDLRRAVMECESSRLETDWLSRQLQQLEQHKCELEQQRYTLSFHMRPLTLPLGRLQYYQQENHAVLLTPDTFEVML